MSGFYTVTDNSDTIFASDIDQLANALNGTGDVQQITLYAPIAAPGAPTVAVNTTAGNLTGAYQYAIVFVTGTWKGEAGTGTLEVAGNTGYGTTSATVNPSSQQVNLSAIPIGPTGTVARIIARTKAGGSTFFQVTQINDNTTTTYTDNTADTSLGAQLSQTNTTGTYLNLPSFASVPTYIAPAGSLCVVNNMLYRSDGAKWNAMSPMDATTTSPGIMEIADAKTGTHPVAITTDNAAYKSVNGGTFVQAGTGITTTPGTNSETVAITNVGTAGTYTKVTTNAQGQVTSGTSLASSDVTNALGYTPANAANVPSSGANTFTGEQSAPDFKVTGLTGATAGARLVGGTASGAPTSGAWSPGDLVVDQSGFTWAFTAPETISSGTATPPVVNGGAQGYAGDTIGIQIVPNQNITVNKLGVYGDNNASWNGAIALFDSSGVNLTGFQAISVGLNGWFWASVNVNLTAGNTYYIAISNTSSGSMMYFGATQSSQEKYVYTNQKLEIDFAPDNNLYYITGIENFPAGTGNTKTTASIPFGVGFNTVTIPGSWTETLLKGYEFEVAKIFGDGTQYAYVYSSATTAQTPQGNGSMGIEDVSASSASQYQIPVIINTVSSDLNYYFEAALETANTSYTAYAGLWDITANALVSGSTLSTSSGSGTAQTVTLRSGAITLTAGHKYALTAWTSNASYDAYAFSARIIASL